MNNNVNTDPKGTRQKVTFITNDPPGWATRTHNPPTSYPVEPHTREYNENNEIHNLSSIGTPDTVPIVNGLFPDRDLGERRST